MAKTSDELIQEYLEERLYEDVEHCKKIGELGKERCIAFWNIDLDSPEAVLAVYSSICDTVYDKLKEKRSKFKEFAISMADFVVFGYDDSEDDGVIEKVGNFSPFIYEPEREVGKTRLQPVDDPELTSIERCTRWIAENLVHQKKLIDEISTEVLKRLADNLQLHTPSNCIILPIFCTIHEQLVLYMKTAIIDAGEERLELNFCSNFDIIATKGENGEIDIEYSPKVTQKLDTKHDAEATTAE